MRKPSLFKLFIAAVTLLGAISLAWVAVTKTPDVIQDAPLLLWVMLVCVIVAELLPINVVIRDQEGELLTSTAFAFATMIAFGPGAAVPALCIASAIGDLTRRKRLPRIVFDVGQHAISLTITWLLMALITVVPRDTGEHVFIPSDLPALALCGLLFFVVNTGLVATVIARSSGRRISTYLASDFLMRSSTSG